MTKLRRLSTAFAAVAVLAACGPQPTTNQDSGIEDVASNDAAAAPDVGDSGVATDAPSATDVMATDSGVADARVADSGVATCSASNVAACAYRPERLYGAQPVVTQMLSYTDATGAMRTFEIAIRRPMGAPQPWPVVVWSHGGATGIVNAGGVGNEWSRVFNAGGYLFVAIAHAPRSEASRAALCAHLGITAATECAVFKYLHWDRPNDVRRTLDWLDEQARGPMAGVADVRRLLYAGHSAGAGSVSMVAGASREYIAGMPRTQPDPRPRAFIGFSIEGPTDDGFTDASFAGITRPHLSVTGVGDRTPESDPAQRRRAFELMAPTNKFRFWNTDMASLHGTFDHNVGPCEDYQTMRGAPVARCEEFYRWMETTALAFADAYLRERPEAIAWLASDNLRTLSNATVEWSRR